TTGHGRPGRTTPTLDRCLHLFTRHLSHRGVPHCPAGRGAELLADASEHTALLDALIAQDLTVVRSLVREHFNGADL
ncbi:hypothetical protein AB0K87_37175, partial [Streptomyces sp. NPDC053705]